MLNTATGESLIRLVYSTEKAGWVRAQILAWKRKFPHGGRYLCEKTKKQA